MARTLNILSFRIAQMPPEMGGMPPGMGAPPPTMPMAAPGAPPRKEISGPLNSIAKVLYDADFNSMVENDVNLDPNEVALQIWQEYGGDDKGLKIDPKKQGCRPESDSDLSDEEAEKAYKMTEGSKWERLPEGKTILDLVKNFSTLVDIIRGTITGKTVNLSMQNAKAIQNGAPLGGAPPGAGGPPPGPPPGAGGPAASKLYEMLRQADKHDSNHRYKEAAFIDRVIALSLKK